MAFVRFGQVLQVSFETVHDANAFAFDHDHAGTKRTGQRVVVRNAYPHPGGWIPIPGNVRMRAVSYYRRARQTRMTATSWKNSDT